MHYFFSVSSFCFSHCQSQHKRYLRMTESWGSSLSEILLYSVLNLGICFMSRRTHIQTRLITYLISIGSTTSYYIWRYLVCLYENHSTFCDTRYHRYVSTRQPSSIFFLVLTLGTAQPSMARNPSQGFERFYWMEKKKRGLRTKRYKTQLQTLSPRRLNCGGKQNEGHSHKNKTYRGVLIVPAATNEYVQWNKGHDLGTTR